jgi:hypothetical protein
VKLQARLPRLGSMAGQLTFLAEGMACTGASHMAKGMIIG